jgi:DNA-binding CsgD family transcriptional regulator
VSAWAIILRDDRDFELSDDQQLADLAAHLTIAVRNFAAVEDARFRTIIGERALRRGCVCWAAFDKDARFIAADPFGEEMLNRVTGSRPVALERLAIADEVFERAMVNACSAFAAHSHASARLVPHGRAFPVAMLLLPFRSRPLTGLAVPAMMALWRTERSHHATNRSAMLSGLFGFSKSESRLADALLQGQTIQEAAQSLNLTLKTARQYSKQLYAKSGARGQSDLMRKILTSVVSLA